jgi:hypothetical protein
MTSTWNSLSLLVLMAPHLSPVFQISPPLLLPNRSSPLTFSPFYILSIFQAAEKLTYNIYCLSPVFSLSLICPSAMAPLMGLSEMTYARGWLIFSATEQTVNIFSFGDHMVSVLTHLCQLWTIVPWDRTGFGLQVLGCHSLS